MITAADASFFFGGGVALPLRSWISKALGLPRDGCSGCFLLFLIVRGCQCVVLAVLATFCLSGLFVGASWVFT